jgi:hypothetical protein
MGLGRKRIAFVTALISHKVDNTQTHFAQALANFTQYHLHSSRKAQKCSKYVSMLMQLATYMKTSTRKTK